MISPISSSCTSGQRIQVNARGDKSTQNYDFPITRLFNIFPARIVPPAHFPLWTATKAPSTVHRFPPSHAPI